MTSPQITPLGHGDVGEATHFDSAHHNLVYVPQILVFKAHNSQTVTGLLEFWPTNCKHVKVCCKVRQDQTYVTYVTYVTLTIRYNSLSTGFTSTHKSWKIK